VSVGKCECQWSVASGGEWWRVVVSVVSVVSGGPKNSGRDTVGSMSSCLLESRPRATRETAAGMSARAVCDRRQATGSVGPRGTRRDAAGTAGAVSEQRRFIKPWKGVVAQRPSEALGGH
jgi:hypothetical protein